MLEELGFRDKRLGLIAAVSENRVIGYKGKLPSWRLIGDLAYFRKKTMDKPIIMGRKTWESLPENRRPLEGRKNIIFSSKKAVIIDRRDVYFKRSFYWALEEAFKDSDVAYVIGGAKMYETAIQFADFIELTEVKGNYKGDVYFPLIDLNIWRKRVIERNITHDYLRYTRI